MVAVYSHAIKLFGLLHSWNALTVLKQNEALIFSMVAIVSDQAHSKPPSTRLININYHNTLLPEWDVLKINIIDDQDKA